MHLVVVVNVVNMDTYTQTHTHTHPSMHNTLYEYSLWAAREAFSSYRMKKENER